MIGRLATIRFNFSGDNECQLQCLIVEFDLKVICIHGNTDTRHSSLTENQDKTSVGILAIQLYFSNAIFRSSSACKQIIHIPLPPAQPTFSLEPTQSLQLTWANYSRLVPGSTAIALFFKFFFSFFPLELIWFNVLSESVAFVHCTKICI